MTTHNRQAETAVAPGQGESEATRTDAPIAGTESTTAETASTDPTTAEPASMTRAAERTAPTATRRPRKPSSRAPHPRSPVARNRSPATRQPPPPNRPPGGPVRPTRRPPGPPTSSCRPNPGFSATTSYRAFARAGTMSKPASLTIPESPSSRPTASYRTSSANSPPASRRLAHGSKHSGLEAKRRRRRTFALH